MSGEQLSNNLEFPGNRYGPLKVVPKPTMRSELSPSVTIKPKVRQRKPDIDYLILWNYYEFESNIVTKAKTSNDQ